MRCSWPTLGCCSREKGGVEAGGVEVKYRNGKYESCDAYFNPVFPVQCTVFVVLCPNTFCSLECDVIDIVSVYFYAFAV